MPKLCKIVLTGGPCAGKSTLLEHAKAALEAEGYTVFVLEEIVTSFYRSGFWRGPRVSNDLFVEATVRVQLANERMYEEFASRLVGEEPVVLLCDRGMPDARAYYDDDAQFERWLEEQGTSFSEYRATYDLVVHLVTAADGAREYYNLGNAARSETPEEAIEVDRRVQSQWEGHPNLVVIANEDDGFEGKLARAMMAIRKTL